MTASEWEIVNLCAIAGRPEDAAAFIASGKSAMDVFSALMYPHGKARNWKEINAEIANGPAKKSAYEVLQIPAVTGQAVPWRDVVSEINGKINRRAL